MDSGGATPATRKSTRGRLCGRATTRCGTSIFQSTTRRFTMSTTSTWSRATAWCRCRPRRLRSPAAARCPCRRRRCRTRPSTSGIVLPGRQNRALRAKDDVDLPRGAGDHHARGEEAARDLKVGMNEDSVQPLNVQAYNNPPGTSSWGGTNDPFFPGCFTRSDTGPDGDGRVVRTLTVEHVHHADAAEHQPKMPADLQAGLPHLAAAARAAAAQAHRRRRRRAGTGRRGSTRPRPDARRVGVRRAASCTGWCATRR